MSMPFDLDPEQYEFLDFGCSAGGSLERYRRFFKVHGKGLGLDVDPEKVRLANSKGQDAVLCDIRELKLMGRTRFILMSHFLEHIQSMADVRKIVHLSCHAAREFVFIRQPYFDADPYLFRLGLKLFWSNWTGHPNNMTLLELHNLLTPLFQANKVNRFCLYGLARIFNSWSSEVHNIDSLIDQHEWDKVKHSEKSYIEFDFPVYKEVIAMIDITGRNVDFVESIFPKMEKLFDSHMPHCTNSSDELVAE